MLVIFETESGRIVTDEIFVRTGVAYEVRTEVVGERGSALIGLDQNLQVKTTDGRWGGQLTPSFVERFGAGVRHRAAALGGRRPAGTIDGPGAWDGYAAVAVCEAGVQAAPHRREGPGQDAGQARYRAAGWHPRPRSRGGQAMNLTRADPPSRKAEEQTMATTLHHWKNGEIFEGTSGASPTSPTRRPAR